MYQLRYPRKIWLWLHVSLIFILLYTPLAGTVQAAPIVPEATAAMDALRDPDLSPTPPPPSTGAAWAGELGMSQSIPNCALLDDPMARSIISGALETALLHACGRDAELTTPTTTAPVAILRPQAVTALGNNVLVNDPAGEYTSMTQSGAVVAYNANNGVLCTAYNDSYHGVVQGIGYTGFSSSSDGGATWVDRGSLNTANSYGYPSLVWRRADGHFYLATLYSSGLGLWDMGAGCAVATWVGLIHTGTDDKEMLAVDNNPTSPYYGRLYTTWTDFADWRIYAAYSNNGGQSWSTPVDVSGHNQVNGAWPAVDPTTGDVYVAWTHWDTDSNGPIDVEMARSIDGGATWNPLVNPMSDRVNPRDATATTTCSRPALNGNIRYYPYPQIAVDQNRVLHAVYSYDPDGYNSGDVVNVYYRRSTDGGVTWETEHRVNSNWNYTDQFSPALAVGEMGTVGVFWYDRRLDSANVMYDRYMALSRDGGVSFEANQRISDESSPVVAGGTGLANCYHGDYDGAAAGGGYFYTVWGDDRRGDADVWSDTEPYFWGRLHGTVYDASTMRGVEGAQVETVHAPTEIPFSTEADATGYYAMNVPGDETYTVTAQAYGYASNTVAMTVDVDGGQADIPLTPISFWNVSGAVTDANTGYPVYAHLTVIGDPFDPPAPNNETWSDGFTGDYILPNLAGSVQYTLTVAAEDYISQIYNLGVLSAHLFGINFALQPDLTTCTAPGYEMAPPCQVASGAVLQPMLLKAEGCPCAVQTHTLYFANHSGADEEVLLSYATSAGATVVGIPVTLGVIPNNAVQPFDVQIQIDKGVSLNAAVYVTVTAYLASAPTISDTAVIEKRAVLLQAPWEWEENAPVTAFFRGAGATLDDAAGVGAYVIGGQNNMGSLSGVARYRPGVGWQTLDAKPTPAANIDAAELNGKIYVAGGYAGGSQLSAFEVLDPAQPAGTQWTTLAATLPVSTGGGAMAAACGKVYFVGGTTAGDVPTGNVYVYDPVSPAAWNTAASMPQSQRYASAVTARGLIFTVGDWDTGNLVQVYDCTANTWLPGYPQLTVGREAPGTAVIQNRYIVAYGGAPAGDFSGQPDVEYLDLDNLAAGWQAGPPMRQGRMGPGGGVAGGRLIAIGGFDLGWNPTNTAESIAFCPACSDGVSIAKSGPEWAYTGDVVSYTVVITTPNWLTGTMELVDALPPGATFTGHVEATYGTAWYSATTNAIYWTRPPSPVVRRAAVLPPQPASPPVAPSLPLREVASLSELPHSQVTLAPIDSGDVIETFTNTWATNEIGLLYNPEGGFVRYAHENERGIFDVDYPAPHPVLHTFKLSAANPGWPVTLDNRDGVGYDYTTGHYFLPDYQGDLSARNDHIVEIDPTGRIINGWETDGAGNDSYDGSVINQIIDIAIVPGAPPRYFVTTIGDGNLVYEVNLRMAGQFVPDTWGTVMTCTVPGIGDTSGIDYDAQNGVLYHSDWNSANIVVTDLHCNVLDAFTCNNGVSGINSGVTFVEGKWPPEVWVTDWISNRTTRCEAVGRLPHPEVVTVTYAVEATAPVSTTLVNEATLQYRGLSLSPAAPGLDTRYVAGTWGDDAVHLLDADLNDLGSFPAGAVSPNGMATDGETIWSGHFSPQNVVAYDFAGHELYRWSAALSGLQGMELVNGELAIYRSIPSFTIEFHDPRTGALHRTIPGRASIEGLAFDGTLLWQLDGDWIYGTNPVDGNVVITITNAAAGCSYGGTGMASHAPGALTLACVNGDWFQASSADGSVLAAGNNGLNMYGLAHVPPQRVADSAAFHVAPRPAITWTKEIYVNGNYVGRYDEGPFTVVPTDEVQLVDRLEYVGREPLFVQLTEDWASYPVELVDAYHSRGVVTLVDGDWYVTLLPYTNARLVKTLHITDTVPVTIYEWLYPDGMPSEERAVSFVPPQFTKNGPALAGHGQLITYTVAFNSQDPLMGSLHLTDTLPAGVEYAGNLHASYGEAWYNPGDNAVYWRNMPAASLTQRAASAPVEATPAEATPRIAPPSGDSSSLLFPPSLSLSLSPSPLTPSATWFPAAPLPTGRVRYAHAQCPGEPNRFYIISGQPIGAAESLWRYDADTDTWATLARLPMPVEGPSAVCYQGRIYVAGGSGTDQFYIYDIARDTWTEGPTLPRGVWGAAFGAWDGRLFLAGGDDNFAFGGQSDEVNIYDIATKTWSGLGATMPVSVSAPGWAQVNEYLYVVGGWGDDSTTHNITATQRYNMMSNIWETGPTFTSGRSDFVLAATGRYLYAIGGDADDGGAFDAVTLTERLDYTNWYGDVWTDIADPLPEALSAYNGSFCTTAKSGGEIWSVGGLTAGWAYSSTNQYRPSEPCVTIPPTVTLTFNVQVTASPGERLTNTAALDFHGYVLTATTAFDVPTPEAAWAKHISVNGVLTATDGIKVLPGDEVQIVDRVWVTYTVPISFTLTEMWTEALTMTGIVADVGVVTWTPAGPATVLANNVAPNTWHAMTKTFVIVEGDWLTGRVTETLAVESGATTSRLVHFAPLSTEHRIYLPLVLRNYGN